MHPVITDLIESAESVFAQFAVSVCGVQVCGWQRCVRVPAPHANHGCTPLPFP